ncbi:MAG: NapC/NirT family cytochrome c [Myxococcota bacterium]
MSDDHRPGKTRTRFRRLVRGLVASRLALVGVGLTTVSAVLILSAMILEWTGMLSLGAYAGLITFLVLPIFFVFGLVLIPLGSWLAWRRARRDGEHEGPTPFVIDLTIPSHRRFWGLVGVLTVVNVLILTGLSYEGYHYTESTQFCGKTCHSVMEPEFEAYKRSPHARVDCVECHIGPGASWFVKSKLSGLRQVYGVIADDFSKPIPTPIHNLRPARDTCEQCHWPEFFHGKRTKLFTKAMGEDGVEDPTVTALALKVGGRSAETGEYHGIHWHVSKDNKVEYRDVKGERMVIPEVRVTTPDGEVVTYVDPELPEPPADSEWRTMDCIDCHNRPTHIYQMPEESVDELLLDGQLPGDMPRLREAAIEAIQVEYPTKAEAEQRMDEELKKAYAELVDEVSEDEEAKLAAAADTLFREAYAINVYPRLNIEWGTYPSHLGHQSEAGCFRCHNDKHEDPEGNTIGQDCDQCHVILAEEQRISEIDSAVAKSLFFDESAIQEEEVELDW